MGKYKVALFSLIGALLLSLAAIFYLFLSKPESPELGTKDHKKGYGSNYNLYKVKQESISTTVAGTGILMPARETSLYFYEVSGVLEKFNISKNTKVTKGEVVAQIQSDSIENNIFQQNNILMQSYIKLNQAEVSIDSSKKQVKLCQINLDNAKNILNAKYTLNNEQEYKKRLIELEQANNELKIQIENKESINLEIQRLKNLIGFIKKEQYKCKLKSPVSGIVDYIEPVSINDYIESGMVIGKVVEPKNIVLKFMSGDLSGFDYGMKVKVNMGNSNYNAVVYKTKPGDLLKALDYNSGIKSEIYISLDTSKNNIELNKKITTVSASIYRKNRVVIPKSALESNGSKYWVRRYNHGKIKLVYVIKGIESGAKVEIIKGLNPNDTIINGY